MLDSRKNEDADDLSERKLDFPVSAVLVNEWSELPDESERDGESRDCSEVDKLGAGDLTDSLRSDEMLDTRLIWLAATCGCTILCKGEGGNVCGVGGGNTFIGSIAGVPGVEAGGGFG
jgi:hypothetical protein